MQAERERVEGKDRQREKEGWRNRGWKEWGIDRQREKEGWRKRGKQWRGETDRERRRDGGIEGG